MARPVIWMLALILTGGLAGGCGDRQEARGQSAAERLRLAEFYKEQGSVRSSLIEINNALQMDPDNARAYHLLGVIQLELQNGKAAEEALSAAESAGIEDADLPALMARALLLQGRFREALSVSGDAPPPSGVGEWYLLRGEALLGLGDLDGADDAFRSAAAEQVSAARASVGLAKVSLARGKSEAADSLLEEALAADDSTIDAWLWTARLAMLREDLSGAERAYGKVRELEANDVLTRRKLEAVQGVMKAKIGQNRLDEAFRYYEDFLAFYPDSLLAEYERGLALFRQGDLAGAEEIFDMIVGRAPGHTSSVLLLGLISYSKGDLSRVASLLQEQALRPDASPMAKRLFAMAQLRLNRADDAVAILASEIQENPDDAELASLYGLALMQTGQADAARQQLERSADLAPDNALVLRNLATFYVSVADPEKALSTIDRISGSDAAAALSTELIRLAALLQSGQQERASSVATRLADRDLQDRGAYRSALSGIARSAVAGNQVDWALEFLGSRAAGGPHNDLPMITEAQLRLDTGDLAGAAGAAERAISASPDESAAWEILGRAQMAAGQPVAAATAFERLVGLRPDYVRAYVDGGVAFARAGDAERARHYMREALRREPLNEAALELAFSLDLSAGDVERARARLSKLREIKSDSPRVREMEGDIHLHNGDIDMAAGAYDDVFRQQPSSARAIKLYAVLARLGKREQAFAHIEAWLADNRSDRQAMSIAADGYLAAGEFERAIALYVELLEEDPDNPEILNNLAWSYHEIGDARALELAEKAHRARPDSAAICDTLGWILVSEGSLDRGISLLRRATELNPDLSDAREHLEIALARKEGR